MSTLTLTRGLPSSGKTTWARAWVAEDPYTRVRVNRDDLRKLIFDAYVLDGAQEDAVTVMQRASVRDLLKHQKDVVVDDTNLSARTVKAWQKLAAEVGAQVEYHDVPTDVETCVAWNSTREKSVSEAVIRRFADRYMKKGKLPEVPEPAVTDVLEVRQYEPNKDLPRTWLFDIDGTLAHMTGRSPYEYQRVSEDLVDESLSRLIMKITDHEPVDDNHPDCIVIMSGRDDSCRDDTLRWLNKHGIYHDLLVMRRTGDKRKDSIVKHELFYQYVEPFFWVQGVFDDRNQVVDMWRAMGLPCYQVAPGDF